MKSNKVKAILWAYLSFSDFYVLEFSILHRDDIDIALSLIEHLLSLLQMEILSHIRSADVEHFQLSVAMPVQDNFA